MALYLTADGGLQTAVPDNGSVPIGTSLAAFGTGFDPAAFAQPALGHAILIGTEDVVVHLFVSSEAPQASNGNFDAAIWFGSATQKGLGAIMTGQAVLPPGGSQMFQQTLEFGDRVPLFLGADDEVTLAAVGAFGDGNEPRLLVGHHGPSFVEFTVRNYTLDPLADVTPLEAASFSGEVANVSGPACADMDGAEARHDIAVAADAVLLRLDLTRTGSLGPVVDNDLFLHDGTRLVAGSTSIHADEAILLAAETLEGLRGRTLTAVVHACGPGPIQYDLDVAQSIRPAAGA